MQQNLFEGVVAPERVPRGRIICGDCIEVMRGLEAESVKAVITSPPYNLSNSTGQGLTDEATGDRWPGNLLQHGYAGHDDAMDHAEYVAWQRECLTEMMRLLRPDGAIFYNHKWRLQGGLLQDRQDIIDGFPVRQIIIWHQPGAMVHPKAGFMWDYEVIYLIAKPEFRVANDCQLKSSIWRMNRARGNPHPAPFPLELPQRCLEALDTGTILDPFLGSGTTAIAAERAGFDWIGIEKSEKYAQIARDRVEASIGRRI